MFIQILISEFNDTKAYKYKTIPYWKKKSPFLDIFPNESLFLLFSHSFVSNSVTPWSAAHQAPLFFSVSQSWLKFMSIESVMPSQSSHPVIPFSSRPQSLPESGPFPMSHLFTPGGQSIGASASASVLPMNIQG